jgi:hypothetical protein
VHRDDKPTSSAQSWQFVRGGGVAPAAVLDGDDDPLLDLRCSSVIPTGLLKPGCWVFE